MRFRAAPEGKIRLFGRARLPIHQLVSLSKNAVLIVEDDENVATYIGDVVEGFFGVEAIKSRSAEAARQRFKRHGERISTIISDMSLPDGAGTALARELVASRPDLRLVFVTGNLVNEQMLEKLVGHKIALLMKPFGPFELKALLESLSLAAAEKNEYESV